MTAGDRARLKMADDLIAFARENLPVMEDDELLPDAVPVDYDTPKASLLRHPGVVKTVRLIAGVAALSQAYELKKFDRFSFPQFIAECEKEIAQADDPRLKSRLESYLIAAKDSISLSPAFTAQFVDYAHIYRNNTAYAVNILIVFARHIVSEWNKAIPAASLDSLAGELDKLQMATLPARLIWFGLSDFAPSNNLPEVE